MTENKLANETAVDPNPAKVLKAAKRGEPYELKSELFHSYKLKAAELSIHR